MVEITWLGHGTYQFRLTTGEVILVDPWIEGNPAYPQGHSIDRVDVILVSHGHFDHIHDVLPLSKKFSPQSSPSMKPPTGSNPRELRTHSP
jgi:L-ascorbate metabolism protein UlaG (beta-lactamase superfamily)